MVVNVAVNTIQEPASTIERLVDALDSRLGGLFMSSYEFPGRYSRWTLGFVNPPLLITGRGRRFTVTALNERGLVLLGAVGSALAHHEHVESLEYVKEEVTGTVKVAEVPFPEEDRSKQPSVFSVVRCVVDLFHHDDDPQLGLYGAFGYDLAFQFEPVQLKQERPTDQRDLVLYLPDQIIVVDNMKQDAWELRYDFTFGGVTTNWQARDGPVVPYRLLDSEGAALVERRDTPPGLFSAKVTKAKEEFKAGNLFEAVLSQSFSEPLQVPPSTIFRRLRKRNPAPYGFFLNLGLEAEFLVGASPEMFVRCEKSQGGMRVETCPISGTIARGVDALEDAQRIKTILANPKEESELTMCTDVDRNDKSRICVPGSVRVLGRRQIEMYSRLIHTVDHVEGYLRPDFDALDAFLCHTWAVTVTGAPKTWAMRFVEAQEESAREWYGGAVGIVGFDGHLNTGLTLRTIHVKSGVGTVRAGATLLFESEPIVEERETELKASALLDVLTRSDDIDNNNNNDSGATQNPACIDFTSLDLSAPRVLLIDHEDSFVHTLANYLRQTGAEVVTCRSGPSAFALLDQTVTELTEDGTSAAQRRFDLVVLSPGPGNPSDFGLNETLRKVVAMQLPCFGVCLGLQAIVEYFGGHLGVLDYPMHGKSSAVHISDDYLSGACTWRLFEGLPSIFEVARYHSLYAVEPLPSHLRITARTTDNVVMALEHKILPIAAVQFHPESILTNPSFGLSILSNCLNTLLSPSARESERDPHPTNGGSDGVM